MDRLLSDLLDVARIASGTLQIIKRRHDVGAFLLEVHGLYEPMFSSRYIRFTVDTPADSINVPFDHDRLVQVLSNLLGNAMKFTQAGGAVALRVERQEDQIVFIVCDNGPGIPQSALSDIFERFWQIDSLRAAGSDWGSTSARTSFRRTEAGSGPRANLEKVRPFRFTLPMN